MASKETVSVALKHPHGLILRVFDEVMVDQPSSAGVTRKVKEFLPRPETVTLKGYLTDLKASIVQMPSMPASFAITHGVPKDHWELWLKQNKDHAYVVNGLIYAHDNSGMLSGYAKEHAALKCGLEPLDPGAMPKGLAMTAATAA